MNATIELTGIIVAAANQAAMQALKRAGVPLAKAQKIILSKGWREELKVNVTDKVKQIKAAK